MTTSLVGAIGAIDSVIDVSAKALELLRKVRRASGPKDSPDTKLLAMALLDVRHNLAVLDCLSLKGVEATDPAVRAVAHAVRLDALVAVLVRWPGQGPEPEPELLSWASKKDFDEWEAVQDQRDKREQLLAHALFVVTRTQALRSLAALPPAIVRPLKPDQRLTNIKRAHLKLVHLLGEEEAVRHLTGRRRKGSDAAE